jgi:hypothetical protein
MLNKKFYKNEDSFYKVNYINKTIIELKNNEIFNLDFDENFNKISNFKKISSNTWKNKENTFFISRHFQWVYNGEKYTTTNELIDWSKPVVYVFHNGKIWIASCSYSTRIMLKEPVSQLVTIKKLIYGNIPILKWTHIKYCRNFKKIP